MSTLQVGRVVLPNTTLEFERNPEGIQIKGMVVSGLSFEAGSLSARNWRDDLNGQQTEQEVIAVVWDGVASDDINGFYILTGSSIVTKQPYANYEFNLELAFVIGGSWTANDIYFQSRLSGGLMVNDVGITTAAEPILAPPAGHDGFDPGTTIPTTMTRSLANGDVLKIYRGVLPSMHPKWSSNPEDFLSGAVVVERI